jgi:hypothetical protein
VVSMRCNHSKKHIYALLENVYKCKDLCYNDSTTNTVFIKLKAQNISLRKLKYLEDISRESGLSET